MAGAAITKINGEGNIPILVGGTGLYVQSLLEGYDFQASRMTAADKRQAEEKLNSLDRENLKAYIRKETDWEPPDWHELLSNTHRLTRLVSAIEQGEGRSFVRQGKAHDLVYDAYVIGLRLPREVLYDRIEKRVDIMVEAGWIDEVRHLLSIGISPDSQAMKAIGYQELSRYVTGTMTLEDAVFQIKARTRHFAKRQLTWFKRMPYIHWYDKDHYENEQALIAAVLADIDL